MHETKSWCFEKINKIYNLLARLIKKKREKTQIKKIRNEKGEVTADITEIQKIIGDYSMQLYANTPKNWEATHQFIEKCNLPSLKQGEIEKMKGPITSTEMEAVIKKLPTNKRPGPDGFSGEFYQTFREELILTLLKLFQKNCIGKNISKVIHDATIS